MDYFTSLSVSSHLILTKLKKVLVNLLLFYFGLLNVSLLYVMTSFYGLGVERGSTSTCTLVEVLAQTFCHKYFTLQHK